MRKRIEIISDDSTDRNIIFLYGSNGSICGLNFHHGILDDEESNGLDPTYISNDPVLFDIYLDICKKSAPNDVNNTFDKVTTANLAIEVWLIRTNLWMRDYVIKEIIESEFEVIYERVALKCYTKSGDITVDQLTELENIKAKLCDIIGKITTNNVK